MKASIKLAALFLLSVIGVLSAVNANAAEKSTPSSADEITFSSMSSLKGLNIKVEKGITQKATVIVYDQNDNVIFKDAISNKAKEKGYILNQLASGDYTIEVIAGKQAVTKQIHVYDEAQSKTFFVKE